MSKSPRVVPGALLRTAISQVRRALSPSVGGEMLSMTRTCTGPRADSSFKPNCSRTAMPSAGLEVRLQLEALHEQRLHHQPALFIGERALGLFGDDVEAIIRQPGRSADELMVAQVPRVGDRHTQWHVDRSVLTAPAADNRGARRLARCA